VYFNDTQLVNCDIFTLTELWRTCSRNVAP